MKPSLLSDVDFGEQSDARWRVLAGKALKGEDVEAALTSQTDDGLTIFAHAARAATMGGLFTRGDKGWSVVQRVDDPDLRRAALQAKKDIQGGATALSFVFEGAADAHGFGLPATPDTFAAVLDGLKIDQLLIRLEPHPQSRAAADWLCDYLRARKVIFSKINLSLGIDPASILATTGRLKMTIEALEASLPQTLAGYFAAGLQGVLLEADGRAYHNAGATEAQELGAVLSIALAHLRMFEKARQPISFAAQNIGFAVAVDQDQFMSMAKLRALRLLWARVLELSGVIEPINTHIHAQTSWRMFTKKDSETNILRSSIAVFAAACGGANSISVLPHTLCHGLPDNAARRIACNTQLVLQDEAKIGFVDDPIAGSGHIEQLTNTLCAAAWAELQRLESEGGLLRSLAANQFQERICAAAAKRQDQFDNKERAIIGTTHFPLAADRTIDVLKADKPIVTLEAAFHCDALVMKRISERFEESGA